jgi:mannose-6-phosphate isomerase-like protein (cupin superfamily)
VAYVNTINERAERLDNFVDGMKFQNMGELVKGRWEETEDGVMTRLVTCPMNISPIMKRITIMEVFAKKDTNSNIIHKHDVEGLVANQVLFVEQGRVDVSFYSVTREKDIIVTCRAGEVVTIDAGRFHSVSMRAGTKMLSVYFPPI